VIAAPHFLAAIRLTGHSPHISVSKSNQHQGLNMNAVTRHIKVVTISRRISDIADRWRAQYGGINYRTNIDHQSIQVKLDQLPADAPLDDVDAIIGNNSWTHTTCDSCSARVRRAISFGEYDQRATVCEPCIRASLDVLSGND
jgi:hypothetical protein